MFTKPILYLTLLLTICSCSKDDQSEVYEQENILLSTSMKEQKLLNLINTYRKSHDLDKLKLNRSVIDEAGIHTSYMLDKKTLSHDNWDIRVQKINTNENSLDLSENVAKELTILEAFTVWIKSTSGHKETILGDYSHTGISIKKDSLDQLYFTQIFLKK